MSRNFLQLNNISSYKTSFQLSNYVWNVVINWNIFARDTVGKQFVRAIDSISANIAEGFGRYTKKDKILFYRYSLSSIKESLDWNQKSLLRELITKEQYEHIYDTLLDLPKDIYSLIKFTMQKLEK